jgi:hypothetical protein
MVKKLTLVTGQPIPDPAASPSDLGPHGARLWQQVMDEYDVSDIGGRQMLHEACAMLDRVEKIREAIDRDGELVPIGRGGSKEHPLLRSEVAARSFVVRTIARLGLNFEPLRSGPGRPSKPGWA